MKNGRVEDGIPIAIGEKNLQMEFYILRSALCAVRNKRIMDKV